MEFKVNAFNYAVICLIRFLLNYFSLEGRPNCEKSSQKHSTQYLVSFCTLCRDFGVSCASSCAKIDSLNRDPDELIPGEADDANDGRGRPPFDISRKFKIKKSFRPTGFEPVT